MSVEILGQVREDVSQSRWAHAVAKTRSLLDLHLRQLMDEQIEEIVHLMKLAAPRLETPDEQVEAYGLFETLAEALHSRGVNRANLNLEIAEAMFNKAALFEQIGQPQGANSTYSQLVSRYSRLDNPDLERLIAKALIRQALCLVSLNFDTEAIEAYGRVDELFSDSSDPMIRERVARALNLKGGLLCKHDRLEEAMERYEEVRRRYSNDREIGMQERIGVSMTNTALVLFRQGRNREALELCETVLSRYGDEPQLWKPTSVALNELGYMTLCEAKQLMAAGDGQKGADRLRHAIELLRDSVNRGSQDPDPIVVGNLGYALFLQGEKEEARRILASAIALGGDAIRNVELKDSEISPIAEDVEFRELVRKI